MSIMCFDHFECKIPIDTIRNIQGRRQVCKSGGAGMLLSAYIQIFGYSPLKVQCTAILLDRMNRKNWGAEAPIWPYSVLVTHLQSTAVSFALHLLRIPQQQKKVYVDLQ